MRLVVVDRAGQRHQERGAADDGEFGDGAGAGAGDHEMRGGEPVGDVGEERRQLGGDAERGVGGAHPVEVLGAALLRDPQPGAQRRRQQGDRGGQRVAEHARAEAAAGDQQADRAVRRRRRVGRAGQGGDRRADRVAGHDRGGAGAAAGACRGMPSASRSAKRASSAVGAAEHGVLLVQDHRRAAAQQARGRAPAAREG